jgi:CMP-N-acetylneuraminic acid synthetase
MSKSSLTKQHHTSEMGLKHLDLTKIYSKNGQLMYRTKDEWFNDSFKANRPLQMYSLA